MHDHMKMSLGHCFIAVKLAKCSQGCTEPEDPSVMPHHMKTSLMTVCLQSMPFESFWVFFLVM